MTPRLAEAHGGGFHLPPIETLDGLEPEALVDAVTQLGALIERARALLLVRPAPKPVAPDDAMLTAKDAASMIGMSEDWVRRHGAREGLAIRIGRRTVRYSRAAITRYAKRRTVG